MGLYFSNIFSTLQLKASKNFSPYNNRRIFRWCLSWSKCSKGKDISKLCKLFLLWLFHTYHNGEGIVYDDPAHKTLYSYWCNANKELQSYHATDSKDRSQKKFDFWITLVLITEDLFYEFLNEYNIDALQYRKRWRTLILSQTCQSIETDLTLFESKEEEDASFIEILRTILSDPAHFNYYNGASKSTDPSGYTNDTYGIIRMYAAKDQDEHPTVHFYLKDFKELIFKNSNNKYDKSKATELLARLKKTHPEYFVYIGTHRDKVKLPDSNGKSKDTVSLKLNELNFLEDDIIESLTAPLS